MTPNDDESSLISGAVGGNTAALELLLYRHRKSVLAYIRKNFPKELRGVLEPQDILQDVWLKAVRAIPEFRPTDSDSLARWLTTIARNLVTDHLKYARAAKRGIRSGQTVTSGDDKSIVRLLEELAIYHRSPSKSAASHELMAALDSAIERLSDVQAQAIRLRHITGLNVREISARMHRSEGSVLMLCNRALKSLRWEMRSLSLYI
jgi:RNA polymerase sigma-70 factor (ECF subfamily)